MSRAATQRQYDALELLVRRLEERGETQFAADNLAWRQTHATFEARLYDLEIIERILAVTPPDAEPEQGQMQLGFA